MRYGAAAMNRYPLPKARDDHDIIYPSAIPFLLIHLACFAAFWTGISTSALIKRVRDADPAALEAKKPSPQSVATA